MKLILCGDIVPTAATVPAFDASDLNALMGDALDVLRSGDFTVGNLECALTNGEERIRKCGPHLKGRPEYAKVLRECGFTHLGLSNNHAMDYGIPGFRDTVSALVDAGITPFGYGENDQDSRRALYLTKDGLTVAIWPCASTNTATRCRIASARTRSIPLTPWTTSATPGRTATASS